ncbi:MAG: S1C family serine protease [Thiobacillus sp.]
MTMTTLRIGMLIALMTFNLSSAAKEVRSPDFKDYPAKATFSGSPAKVILDTQDAKQFRTRLRQAAKQPADFAGDNVLALWGCGTTCVFGAAVNLRTGHVVPLPGSICCSGDEEERLQYHKGSRLLIAYGRINEGEPYGKHYYEFTGLEFRHIRTIAMEDTYLRDFDTKMREGFKDAQKILSQQNVEPVSPANIGTRGWLGIEVQNLTPAIIRLAGLKNGKGVLVAGVLKDGPAGNAGIEPGDVLVGVNDNLVADSASLLNLVAPLEPGETAKLVVIRGNLNLEFLIRVAHRP